MRGHLPSDHGLLVAAQRGPESWNARSDQTTGTSSPSSGAELRDVGRVARVSYGGDVARALITNDDGIDSPGLWALAAAARDAGLEVVVAAPHLDSSGRDVRALGAGRRPDRGACPRAAGASRGGGLAVEGHPAYIVHVAGRGWLDPAPDIVLSGINVGANVGHAVLHSGTVGAALTAARHGWRGLAVSLETAWPPPERLHWVTAVAVLPAVLDVVGGHRVAELANTWAPVMSATGSGSAVIPSKYGGLRT